MPNAPLDLPTTVDPVVRRRLLDAVARDGFALYRLRGPDGEVPDVETTHAALHAWCGDLGLRSPLGTLHTGAGHLTRIEADTSTRRGEYIPYTRRAMGWHTDGYYAADEPVRSFVLHCVRPAARGGASRLLDPRQVHARLEAAAPALARLLEQPVLHVPANHDDAAGRTLREAVTVPVFERDTTGSTGPGQTSAGPAPLLVRYSRRKRHLHWVDLPRVAEAVALLDRIIDDAGDRVVTRRLAAGEGVVCNNVLHARDAFEDDGDSPRLLLRGRFAERVRETSTRRRLPMTPQPNAAGDDTSIDGPVTREAVTPC